MHEHLNELEHTLYRKTWKRIQTKRGKSENLGQDNEDSTRAKKHFANWIIKINYPTAYAF